MKILRTLVAAATVLAVAACTDTPTSSPAADDARVLASGHSSLGEISIDAVDEFEDRWEVTFSTPEHPSIASRQWQHLPPGVAASGDSGAEYVVIRYREDDAGCVEVSLSTQFTDSTSKWRSAAVYVGGIIPECSDVSS